MTQRRVRWISPKVHFFQKHRSSNDIIIYITPSIWTPRMTRNKRPEEHHKHHHRHQPSEEVKSNDIFISNVSTHSGWRLLIPWRDAMAPVMNGRNALPAWPKPAIQPIEPVKIHRGRTREAWFMTMGYIGPSRTPTMDTATALPMSEGTSQMVISKLDFWSSH